MKNARITLSPISRLKQGELNNVYSLLIMRKVRKIGTRWGNYGPGNLDLFSLPSHKGQMGGVAGMQEKFGG